MVVRCLKIASALIYLSVLSRALCSVTRVHYITRREGFCCRSLYIFCRYHDRMSSRVDWNRGTYVYQTSASPSTRVRIR